VFDSSMFFFFMFLLYFYDFVQKNGPGRESNKHTLLCNQSKSASEPVNNFYMFYDFVQKNGPGRESNKHTLLCNQSKSASEPVNNFYIFYKQLNIYFTNVWHPQENNSRSATAHTFFVLLQEI